MNILLPFVGIVSASLGLLLFCPSFIAAAVILIATPFILVIADNMLIDKWSQVIIVFLLVVGYISVSIWALSLFINTTSFHDRVEPSTIIIGAGVIQLFWIFLFDISPNYKVAP